MAEGTIKTQIIALLKLGADEQRAFIASLNDSQRGQAGTSDKWSAKDNLTHIAYWQTHLIEEFRILERGETPQKLPGDNEQNETIFQEHRNQSWPEVIVAAESAYTDLAALLESYSEADLTTPNRLPPPRNNPLWRYFLNSGYAHPVFHYADYYLEHGDLARATALQQRLAKDTASVGNDESRGIADYNLACFYAKTGQKAPALELLPGALKLAPDLLDWSKEDPDLVSLHDEPAYKALYA
jgi:hypothetical protein